LEHNNRFASENYAFEDAYKILEELSDFKCSMVEIARALGTGWQNRKLSILF
jgi:hypothetical protein